MESKMDVHDSEELEFIEDRLDGLANVRISLINMLTANQDETKQMEMRKKELEDRNHPEGCTCMRCEEK